MSSTAREKVAQEGMFNPWNDPEAKPLISFKNVTKKFGTFTAIDNLSIDIFEREFFALLGPSGCGKTTLMRMLAGFEAPTTGQIFLDGVDIGNTSPNKRAVNMMFQSYALFPHLTVAQNIAFGLKRSNMPKDEIAARVDEMLRLVQLSAFPDRKPHQISGGQRQRVALARSLAKAPKLLLLDEPLGALDKKLRQETQFELMDIQESTGTTFVIVTHDQEEAMTVASRIAVMNHGKLEQVATPDQLYEAPNSVYVADFIGEINLIEGVATPTGADQYQLAWSTVEKPFAATSAETIADGETRVLAVRPEKISISTKAPQRGDNIVAGKVLDIGYLGNISTFHVQLADGSILKAQTANTDRRNRSAITWEQDVWLSWQAESGVLLPSFKASEASKVSK